MRKEINSRQLTFDKWFAKYKPVQNENAASEQSFDGCAFETFGKDWERVKTTDFHHVWTYLSGDGDVLLPGRYIVNRYLYFVTEVPWKDGAEFDRKFWINMEH